MNARRKQTRGKCLFCGEEYTRGGLVRHLAACDARQQVIAEADQGPGKEQPLYHLQIQDAWGGDYWLHVEMKGSATLKDLDYYLRAIWLECCGHMSQFSFGGWSGEEIPMSRTIAEVLDVDDDQALTHIYDFGTSSETLVTVRDVRRGKPLTPDPIKLMARNNPPAYECMECEEPATYLCIECVYEMDESGLLCDAHAETHPHDDYGEPLPLVNSPRVGMCGDVSPAEPPY